MEYTLPHSEELELQIPTQCMKNVRVLGGDNFLPFMNMVEDVKRLCKTTTEDFGDVEWFLFSYQKTEHLFAHARNAPDGEMLDFALIWSVADFQSELTFLANNLPALALAKACAFAGNAAEYALAYSPIAASIRSMGKKRSKA